MTLETDKQNLIEKTFRRDSLKDNGVEIIESWRLPGIFGQMGQHFDQKELDAALKDLDKNGSGKLTEEMYKELCAKFVTDPAALAKFHGDEFTFKHLISLNDFARP